LKIRPLESVTILFAWSAGLILLSAVSLLLGYLFFKGYQSVNLALIFGETSPLQAILLKERVFDGLFPAMAGTLVLVVLSIIWAIPVGMATGIYLAEYAGSRTKKGLDAFLDVLSGMPSIVIGLFGFSLAIFLHKHYSDRIGPCLLISSIALSLLVLPYIIRTTQGALESIPLDIRLTALALGASKLQNIFLVLIPKSFAGIMSGIILAIGRCAEDTAVIMLTGAVASAGLPKSLFSQYEALPFYIYYISSQYSTQDELMQGYGAAIILLLLCGILFSVAFVIRKGLAYFAYYKP
jgi:phosphate transport system permease protein